MARVRKHRHTCRCSCCFVVCISTIYFAASCTHAIILVAKGSSRCLHWLARPACLLPCTCIATLNPLIVFLGWGELPLCSLRPCRLCLCTGMPSHSSWPHADKVEVFRKSANVYSRNDIWRWCVLHVARPFRCCVLCVGLVCSSMAELTMLRLQWKTFVSHT